MSDITANLVVGMPAQLFTLARSFKANANGKIYIGQPDTDPTNPANQIQVYVENEDGSLVPVPQPIIINAGGFPVLGGQIKKFVTTQNYSMLILDAYGAQQFYFEDVAKYDPDQFEKKLSNTLDPLQGDALIGVRQPFTGAVAQTQHDFNKIYVSVTNFGAIPAATADAAVDITSALKAALSSGASDILIPPGFYIVTEKIVTPPYVTLRGSGVGFDRVHSTQLLFKGTGSKTESLPGVTSVSVANPDAGAAYLADSGTRGDVYRTNDFSIPFSAAIVLGHGSSLLNIGVMPWFEGVAGYFDDTNFNLADEWDVGVWARNAGGCKISGCMIAGHWRKAGLLQTSTDIGDTSRVPECERAQIEFCSFEGLYGVSIRSLHTATADTNYGFAGTDYINCYFRGLWHNTLHLATSSMLTTPFDRPSGCLEMDGAFGTTGRIRGVQFLNCTFTNKDDIIIFMDNVAEPLFSGCYYESQPVKVNGVWLENSQGGRMIATANSLAVQHLQSTSYGVDTSPYFSVKDFSIRTGGRYDPSKSGVFNPSVAAFDDWQNLLFSGSIGHRLRNPSQQFNINAADGANIFNVNAAGNVRFTNTLASLSDSVNIKRTVAGSQVPVLRTYTTGNMQLGDETGTHTLTLDGAVIPYADGASNVGMNAARFGTIFAQTGTINTSEATEKSDPVDISALSEQMSNDMDAILDAWGDVSIIAFRWLSSLAEKGDGEESSSARWHFGVIAQQVRDAFVAHGIDGTRFGLLCHDEWKDVTRPVMATKEVISFAIVDGKEVERTDTVEYETGETEVVIAAGSRWGIRPDQCAWLEAAYQRRRSDRIEERLAKLEAR